VSLILQLKAFKLIFERVHDIEDININLVVVFRLHSVLLVIPSHLLLEILNDRFAMS
jgi:hypothetical protein